MSYRGKGKGGANNNGTGFGGTAGGNDQKKLIAGRKRALAREHKKDAETIKYLKRLNKALRVYDASYLSAPGNKDFHASDKKLVDTLREIFRNAVPTDWDSRSNLYNAALDVCRSISLDDHLPNLFGDPEDDESLLSALAEFAKHADMIKKRTGTSSGDDVVATETADDMNDVELATRVLEMEAMATKAAMAHRKKQNGDEDALSVMSQEVYYKGQLGPLRFDIVSDLQHHAFLKTHAKKAPVGLDTRRIFKELTSYKTSLPVEHGSAIFARAVDNRLDFIRALITGPDNTPYAHGCFIFDVMLPASYPKESPKVQFMTTGGGQVRFNPNLYNNGKVCLSLLGTWSGPGWISGESTLLQVLVSIQSLILVPDPYFNEPGWERDRGTARGDTASEEYNKKIRRHTQTLCIEQFLKDVVSDNHTYPEFADVIEKHFFAKRAAIEHQVNKWAQLDPSIASTSGNICNLLSQLAQKRRPRKQHKTQRIFPAAVGSNGLKPNELIDLLDDDDSENRKPSQTFTAGALQVIDLDNDDVSDDDRKPPAQKRTKPAGADATTTAVEVVDLTL